jgi:hypothetical protein
MEEGAKANNDDKEKQAKTEKRNMYAIHIF